MDRWFTASDGVKLHCLEVQGRALPSSSCNVIVPGRTHLTTLIDPLYRQRLVSFIEAHDAR